jgi:hypothetical protein
MDTEGKASRQTKGRKRESKIEMVEMKVSDMSVIDNKISALLIAEGYTVVEAKRLAGHGLLRKVNQMHFMRGDDQVTISISTQSVK